MSHFACCDVMEGVRRIFIAISLADFKNEPCHPMLYFTFSHLTQFTYMYFFICCILTCNAPFMKELVAVFCVMLCCFRDGVLSCVENFLICFWCCIPPGIEGGARKCVGFLYNGPRCGSRASSRARHK